MAKNVRRATSKDEADGKGDDDGAGAGDKK